MSQYQTHKRNRDYVTKGNARKLARRERSESAPIETVASQMGVRVQRPNMAIVVR